MGESSGVLVVGGEGEPGFSVESLSIGRHTNRLRERKTGLRKCSTKARTTKKQMMGVTALQASPALAHSQISLMNPSITHKTPLMIKFIFGV